MAFASQRSMFSRKSPALKYMEDSSFADECRPECTVGAAVNSLDQVEAIRKSISLFGLNSRESGDGQIIRRERGPKPNEDRVKMQGLMLPQAKVPLTSLLINDGHDGTIACDLVHSCFNQAMMEHLVHNGGDYIDACTRAIDALEENLKTQNTTSGVCILNVLNAGRHLWCGNLGDCRGAYIPIESVPSSSDQPGELRFGNLVWLSRDLKASDPQEVERITRAGGRVIEGRVQGVLEPSRTLGDFDVKRACQKENIISIIPEVRYLDLASTTNSRDNPNNSPVGCGIILMATDGVWDFTSAKDVLEILNGHKTYIAPLVKKARDMFDSKPVDLNAAPGVRVEREAALESVCQYMVKRSRERGSQDDRTAIMSLTCFSTA